MISGVWLVWVWSSTVFGWFGYRGETYELSLVLAIGVRPVSWWPWVAVG
jgi:low temperature requirement protein LtrA